MILLELKVSMNVVCKHVKVLEETPFWLRHKYI